MARYRKLQPDHYADKNLGRGSDLAWRIWCTLVAPLADDDGRFELDLEDILAKVYLHQRNKCITEIEDGIMELQKLGVLQIYENGSGPFLCQLLEPFPYWAQARQSSYYTPSKFPAPTEENIIPFITAEQLRNTYGIFRNHSGVWQGQLSLSHRPGRPTRARASQPPPSSKSKNKKPAKPPAPDPLPFKSFPAISHQQIKMWASEFEGSDEPDSKNKICEHLFNFDCKMSLPAENRNHMMKPGLGKHIANLHALLRKRYGR